MSFKHQKIILAFELAAVIAMTIYSGGHALNVPAQAAAETVVETETESVKKTAKDSKEESETKKSKEKKTAKETKKKDEKPETKVESETVKKAAENKDSDKKDDTSSGNTSVVSGNNTDDNSSAPAVGTSSEPAGNTASSTRPSGNNNSQPSGTGSNTPSPSGGTSTAPATPSPSTPQTQAPATTTPAHQHNWIESRHEEPREDGHWGEKIITEAWDEPIYEMVETSYCSTCGLKIEGDPGMHLDETMHGGYWTTWEPVPIDSVHHEAIKEPVWIVDRTWTEMVSDGYYVCSECGATKSE